MHNLYGKDLCSEIERFVDPGVQYSVKTPAGITYSVLNPAAAHGSSDFMDFATHKFSEKSKGVKRRP